MADASHNENMADNEHTNKGQVQSSPFFTKLPAELRLKIYEEIFEGSKTTYKQRLEVGDRTYHNILLPTSHRNFLLTCRQAYNEAQEAYWHKTILYGDSDDVELVFFLRSVVPDPAKMHIKHIRGLRAVGLLGQVRAVRGCLEEFENLQIVGFVATCTHHLDSQHWFGTGMTPIMEDHAEEQLKKFEARNFSPLIYDSGPAVVFRLLFRRSMFLTGKPAGACFKQERKMCFYNYNTREFFFDDGPNHIGDEEACFAMVLDN